MCTKALIQRAFRWDSTHFVILIRAWNAILQLLISQHAQLNKNFQFVVSDWVGNMGQSKYKKIIREQNTWVHKTVAFALLPQTRYKKAVTKKGKFGFNSQEQLWIITYSFALWFLLLWRSAQVSSNTLVMTKFMVFNIEHSYCRKRKKCCTCTFPMGSLRTNENMQ